MCYLLEWSGIEVGRTERERSEHLFDRLLVIYDFSDDCPDRMDSSDLAGRVRCNLLAPAIQER